MYFDFMPVFIALAVITIGPLVVGLVFRLFGLRLLARVAAALSIIACLIFVVLLELQDGSGWFLVTGQIVLAIGLWAISPMKAATLTGEPADDTPPA